MSTHASDHLTASFRLGVHVGATYTDVPLVDQVSGRTWAETASTPAGQAVGVLTGVDKVCAEAGIGFGEVGQAPQDHLFDGPGDLVGLRRRHRAPATATEQTYSSFIFGSETGGWGSGC